MSKIKEIFKTLKNNSFIRIIIELIFLLILFNVNEYIGLGLLLVILFEIVVSKNVGDLLSIFLFLSFNDEILKLDLLKGSISRIVLVFLVLKLIYYILKNKIRIQKKHFFIVAFFVISCLIDLNNIIDEGIILLNIFVVVLFSICILHGVKNKDKLIEKICFTIIVSVLASVLYGLITANFLEYVQDEKTIYRFNGSYEPNFMCMYINLAIFSLVTLKNKVNKWAYYIILAVFLNAILLTMSMTGIITLIVGFIIYFVLFRKDWKIILGHMIYITIISCIVLFGVKQVDIGKYVYWVKNSNIIGNMVEKNNNINVDDIDIYNHNNDVNSNDGDNDNHFEEEIEDSKKGGLIDRIKRIYHMLTIGKIDEVTSGRTALLRTFVTASFNRPIFNVLFGNNPVSKKIYTSFFDRDCLAHNSFADFLYNFGIVGFCIIVAYMGYVTKKNIFMNVNISSSLYVKNIKVIRIMLILFALSLTLYTKRMFLIFFLL